MKKLYIVGAGGLGRQIAWIVERINEKEASWNLAGFIDDDTVLKGQVLNGIPVVGGIDALSQLEGPVWLVTALGSVRTRKAVVDRICSIGRDDIHFATLIDPSVIISKWVEIGEGSVICAGSIVTVNITIGKHVLVNWDCTVGHDSTLGDFCTLSPSSNICGNVHLGQLVDIGVGAQVIQGHNIVSKTTVGAGAVVTKDITDSGIYVGVPATLIKQWGGVILYSIDNYKEGAA